MTLKQAKIIIVIFLLTRRFERREDHSNLIQLSIINVERPAEISGDETEDEQLFIALKSKYKNYLPYLNKSPASPLTSGPSSEMERVSPFSHPCTPLIRISP